VNPELSSQAMTVSVRAGAGFMRILIRCRQ